jgi:hypothetical protein
MPVDVAIVGASRMSTAGPPPRIVVLLSVETMMTGSVKVPVPMPDTVTVAVPLFTRISVLGAGPGCTFAVSPVTVTVTCAFVNGFPPRVPETFEVSE